MRRRNFLTSALAAGVSVNTAITGRRAASSCAQPKGYAVGLMSRRQSEGMSTAARGKIKGFVYDLKWRDCQPNGSSDEIPASVRSAFTAALDYARANGMTVRLRAYAGIHAPTWAQSIGGPPLPCFSDDNPTGTVEQVGTVGRFWRSAYQDRYDAWHALLATEFGPHPALVDVTIAGTMTQYAEPMQRKWKIPENRTVLLDAGYTSQADIDMTVRGFAAHHARWSPHGVASTMAYNPWNHLDLSKPAGWYSDWPTTQVIMDEHRQVMGRFCVWQNNSLRDPLGFFGPAGSPYRQMYDYMETGHAEAHLPIGFQTASMMQLRNAGSTLDGTVDLAVALGGQFVEMPAGWLTDADPAYAIDQAQAATFNARLLENRAT